MALPIWCAVLPLHTTVGEAEACPRLVAGMTQELGGMAAYAPGRDFDDVMLETYRQAYPDRA